MTIKLYLFKLEGRHLERRVPCAEILWHDSVLPGDEQLQRIKAMSYGIDSVAAGKCHSYHIISGDN